MDDTLVFIDIETTGLDPDKDEIIEIGAVAAVNGEIKDRFSTLVKPAGKLPLKIKSLTGITDEMLADAPSFQDVAGRLVDFIGDKTLVGHNVSFDLNFLQKKLGSSIGNPVLDTMDFVQVALPTASSYRLEAVKLLLGANNGTAHRGLADAEACCHAYFRCLNILRELNHEVLLKLYEMACGQGSEFARKVARIAGEAAATFPAEKAGSGFAFLSAADREDETLFSGSANRQGAGASSGTTVPPVDLAAIGRLLGDSGPFAAWMPQYKFRPGQLQMLETVWKGFAEDKHMIIEAGTGTGKSLAYLVPAVAWSVTHQTKVVIATHTINLQEQLWRKDLPAIGEATGWDFSAALVKGRNNYLCLRRWESAVKSSPAMMEAEAVFHMKALVWLAGTNTGDRTEINITPGQYQYWNDICSDQDTCLGPACHWFQRQCFVTRSRKQAEQADVLVVNHSLLFTDIKLQNRLLPAYDYLVIDEAHHLEDSATEQLGWTVSTAGLKSMLFSLVRGYSTGLGPGVINQMRQALRNNPDVLDTSDGEKLESILNEGFDKVSAVHDSVGEMDDLLKNWVARECGENGEESFPVIRIKDSHRGNDTWDVFVSIRENYSTRSKDLIRTLRKAAGFFEAVDREQLRPFLSILKDFEFHAKFLEETNGFLHDFFYNTDGSVYWIEADLGAKGDSRLKGAPVSVSEILHECLFLSKKSTLLTSATICVDGSFEHFEDRVGLAETGEDRTLRLISPSPFSYESQALLCVTRDVPDPTTVPDTEYIEHIVPAISQLAAAFGGRTLVLFTSHKMLRQVYFRLQQEMEQAGITLLGHRIDGGRTRLTEEFRRTDKAVLLGASSFWEGIDLPGDILKCVIIARLPFAPPNTPVVEARIEELSRNKRDAFYSYTVPEAVIKLKQGFGRLIRSEEDTGVVVILDRRIVDRRYGRKFLNSLPVKTHFKGDTPTVIQKVADWMQGERPQAGSFQMLDIDGIDRQLKQLNKRKKR